VKRTSVIYLFSVFILAVFLRGWIYWIHPGANRNVLARCFCWTERIV